MALSFTRIDLHTHSRVSDGTQSPTELIDEAVAAGLDCLGLTDHDNTDGWDEAACAAEQAGIGLVRGIELSTITRSGSMHMLAYLFDPTNRALTELTAEIRDSREHRAERIVARLAKDFPVTWADVLAQSGEAKAIGRPHIADALVERGIVTDRTQAFDRMLHPRAGYYEPYFAPDPVEAITLIREAGGVPVVAHPATVGRGAGPDDDLMHRMADAGLGGLEVWHRLNPPEFRAHLMQVARTYDLIVTGSSDYHGAGKPNRLGENLTPPDQLERIVEQATGVPVLQPQRRATQPSKSS